MFIISVEVGRISKMFILQIGVNAHAPKAAIVPNKTTGIFDSKKLMPILRS